MASQGLRVKSAHEKPEHYGSQVQADGRTVHFMLGTIKDDNKKIQKAIDDGSMWVTIQDDKAATRTKVKPSEIKFVKYHEDGMINVIFKLPSFRRTYTIRVSLSNKDGLESRIFGDDMKHVAEMFNGISLYRYGDMQRFKDGSEAYRDIIGKCKFKDCCAVTINFKVFSIVGDLNGIDFEYHIHCAKGHRSCGDVKEDTVHETIEHCLCHIDPDCFTFVSGKSPAMKCI
jgi:hypothetical protein